MAEVTDHILPSTSPPAGPASRHTVSFEGEDLVIDASDWRHSALLRLQIVGGFLVFILFGLAEQTVGTLIPKFQEHYKIGDVQTGFIFLASVSGYFIMAFLSEHSHAQLGVRGVLVAGMLSMTMAYLVILLNPPFVVLVLSYVFNGIGFGAIDASLGTWMGKLVDHNELLGILHGCYGIGCMISPPLITSLLERKVHPWHWNQYYLVLALVGGVCIVWLAATYRHESPKKYRYMQLQPDYGDVDSDFELSELGPADPERDSRGHDQLDNAPEGPGAAATTAELLRTPRVWFLALILFVYVGDEVAFGAWVVSYLTRVKLFSYENASYLALSFWLGLTVGRIGLGFATTRAFKSAFAANFAYIALSFSGYAIFGMLTLLEVPFLLYVVAFVTGVFVGPIFPTTIVCLIELLPRRFHTGGVGFICAFGGGGAAVLPFIVGIVALTHWGLALFPLIIAAISLLLLAMWLELVRRYMYIPTKL